MRSFIVLLLCGVFVCVDSECSDLECTEEVIKQILEEEDTATDVVDLKLVAPGFKQIKNVELQDVKNIVLGLTQWFEHKLNESTFIYKNVHNKTKIFVKSFDFSVDFEKGKARIDMGLAKEFDEQKTNATDLLKIIKEDYDEETSTTPDPSTELDNMSSTMTDAIGHTIDAIIERHKNVNNVDIYNTVDFDTTYYDVYEEDNSTDYPIIDYIELYKDTTNEENVYTGTELPTTLADFSDQTTDTKVVSFESLLNDTSTFQSTVFPWIATIFIKNSTENSQFHYFCDGALLSEKVILTGGRCVHHSTGVVAAEDILVFLGKTNLQAMDGSEKLYRVKNVFLHNNFTLDLERRAQNDLAILILDVAAEFDDRIQSSCIHLEEATEVQEAATTAWGPNGQLLPIFFEEEKSDICFDKGEDIFCATYGQNIPLCPSYGGIYATKRMSRWCIQGIFYGDPTKNGLCFNKNVLFTSLRNYFDWIDDYIVINANIL
ncbi:unnamed protein product [Arctia plantaginis]|uniref:Peptidase S1 domain-containing protein n=1 Tax=Arctia plantaginis TaxID=874455 RepID=A0A8S0Z5N4_ARCPL|nr:unnamed protein product [Arctia plantaginis]